MKLDGLKKYKRSCPGKLPIRVKETGSTAFDVIFQGDFTLLVKQWEKICFRSLKIFQLNVCTLGKYWFPNFHKDYCSCKKNPSYSIFDKVVMDCNGSQMSELLFPSQCFCICPMSFFFFDKEHQDSIYIRILLLTSEALKFNSKEIPQNRTFYSRRPMSNTFKLVRRKSLVGIVMRVIRWTLV